MRKNRLTLLALLILALALPSPPPAQNSLDLGAIAGMMQ